MLRCKNDNTCVHSYHHCDGVIDCTKYRDDEIQCESNSCKEDCQCLGNSMVCKDVHIYQHYMFSDNWKQISIYNSTIILSEWNFNNTISLLSLTLSNIRNSVELVSNLFSINIAFLHLNNNKIFTIFTNAFYGLIHIRILDFHDSVIFILRTKAFNGLHSLSDLNLCGIHLMQIDGCAFCTMNELRKLNLSGNDLTKLSNDMFLGINKLQVLSIEKNNIYVIELFVLSANFIVYTDNIIECCYFRLYKCMSKTSLDIFECNYDVHMKLNFVLVIVDCIGVTINLYVYIKYIAVHNKFNRVLDINRVMSKILQLIHSISICLGVFIFKDNLLLMEYYWMPHFICKCAGILFSSSLHSDMWFSCIRTLNIYVIVKYPFRRKGLTLLQVYGLLFIIWTSNTVYALLWSEGSNNISILCLPQLYETPLRFMFANISIMCTVAVNVMIFTLLCCSIFIIYKSGAHAKRNISKHRPLFMYTCRLAVTRFCLVVAYCFLVQNNDQFLHHPYMAQIVILIMCKICISWIEPLF